jgi:hypothetical protein
MARLRRVSLLIVSLLAAAGSLTYCAAAPRRLPQVVAPQPIIITMRRWCGACPNYLITLTSDGWLTYEGAEYARVSGRRTMAVDSATMTAVLYDLLESEFLEMDNAYPAPGADRMTVSISIQMDGLSKSVLSEDRYGPALLLEIERKMDDLPGMRALSGWTH